MGNPCGVGPELPNDVYYDVSNLSNDGNEDDGQVSGSDEDNEDVPFLGEVKRTQSGCTKKTYDWDMMEGSRDMPKDHGIRVCNYLQLNICL